MSWLFDQARRVRRGGSAAAYAFKPDLDVFVREVVQNAKDQKRSDVPSAHVHFRLMRLKGHSLNRFLDALYWQELRAHLESSSEASAHAEFIKRALERLDQSGEMLLLRVDDSGTGGLVGGDLDEDKPFGSLCIDELFSSKQSSGAGGSYGLGKSVLWRFSGFSSVLFSSLLKEYDEDQQGLRVFGRTQLPWHRIGHESFDGPCWFGRKQVHDGQPVAFSLWGQEAESIASRLHLDRPDTPGTSILIVGFNPPADETLHPRELCQRFCAAASWHFWPVLTGNVPELEVTSELVNIETGKTDATYKAEIGEEVRPFMDCLEKHRSGSTVEELAESEDVAAVSLPFRIPPKISGAPAVDGFVTLCVRLVPKSAKRANQVAYARGFGMVVRYRNLEGISLSARPFVATLLCGTLRGDSPEDQAIEQFLRLAEPPEHNTWESNQRLQSTYRKGYAKVLDQLNRQVDTEIKRLVSTATTEGEKGPELLSRMFPIGTRGPDKRDHPFSVTNPTAALDLNGRWVFGAEVKRTRGAERWRVRVALRFSTDDGAEKSVIGFLDLTKGAVHRLRSGVGIVDVDASVGRVRVKGLSDPALHPVDARRASVRLDVMAGVIAGDDDPENDEGLIERGE